MENDTGKHCLDIDVIVVVIFGFFFNIYFFFIIGFLRNSPIVTVNLLSSCNHSTFEITFLLLKMKMFVKISIFISFKYWPYVANVNGCTSVER